MMNQPHILVIGAGAIGGFYGAILKRAGCVVSAVARSDYETVRARGLAVSSPLGDLSYRPDYVYRDGDTPRASPDYVLCCVKVLPGADRAALLAPWMDQDTAIVLIENGIDIEPAIAEAFPEQPLISALAYIAVSRGQAPGAIEHKAYGRLTIGAWPQGVNERCRTLAGWLCAGGINVKLTAQVVRERWRKSLWNTTFNPLSVLAGGADTATLLDTPGGEALAREIMAEVMAVAAAHGYPLPADTIDKNIAGTRRMPAYRNSMALDYLAGRPLEIEAILGNVVAIAHRFDVSVPRLDTLYAIFRMRDS